MSNTVRWSLEGPDAGRNAVGARWADGNCGLVYRHVLRQRVVEYWRKCSVVQLLVLEVGGL